MRKTIVASLCLLLSAIPARPQNIIGSGVIGDVKVAGGGALPTWTGTGAASNASCGFSSPCSITGLTITAGYAVVMVGGDNPSGGASTVTAVTLCGTSLTQIISPSGASSHAMAGLFGGTVAGGTCTLSASAPATWQSMSASYGTLNNLSSTTASGTCSLVAPITQNSPYTCTSSLTIASGGFAISGIASANNNTYGGGVNTTLDAQSNSAVNSTAAIGHFGTAGSNSPSYTGGNFDDVIVLGATWR